LYSRLAPFSCILPTQQCCRSSARLAGFIVVKAGYSAAFLTLAGIAGTGLLLFWLAMPETIAAGARQRRSTPDPRPARRGEMAAIPAE
jgi:hypothetical protein